jgi:phosphatidylglycerophosphate synthase
MNSSLNLIWTRTQNVIGFVLMIVFLAYPFPRLVFISIAFWIFISTTVTAILLKTTFTIANTVTISRAYGLVFFSFLLAYNQSVTNLSIFILGICLMADFFDGYLARIFTTSSAGKVLDGETDQQFVLVTASAAFLFLNMPYWLLLFPGIKYIFGICYDLFKLRLKEKIGEKRRKIVAACVMISLFMNLAFLVSEKASLMLYLITLLLLSYSFFADLFGALKIKSKE